MIRQCTEQQRGRMRWSTAGVYTRPADDRRCDERAGPGEPRPQSTHRPARAAPCRGGPHVAHAPTCNCLVFRVSPVALDHLPRVIRPNRDRVFNRIWCGPGPRRSRKEQDQRPHGPPYFNRFWERRVDGAR